MAPETAMAGDSRGSPTDARRLLSLQRWAIGHLRSSERSRTAKSAITRCCKTSCLCVRWSVCRRNTWLSWTLSVHVCNQNNADSVMAYAEVIVGRQIWIASTYRIETHRCVSMRYVDAIQIWRPTISVYERRSPFVYTKAQLVPSGGPVGAQSGPSRGPVLVRTARAAHASAQSEPSGGPTRWCGRGAVDWAAQSEPSEGPTRWCGGWVVYWAAQSGPSEGPTHWCGGRVVDGAAQPLPGSSPVVCPVGPLLWPIVFVVQTPPGAQWGCPVTAQRMPNGGPVGAQANCWLDEPYRRGTANYWGLISRVCP